MLMRFFKRNSATRCEAEDLVQEVALKIIGRSSNAIILNEKAFSFEVARNVMRDYQKFRSIDKSNVDHVSHDELYISMPSMDPRQDRIAEGRQELAIVISALEELEDRTKDIFVLFKFEGMKHSEISELMGISVSAVEKHVAKAVAHLAVRIGR